MHRPLTTVWVTPSAWDTSGTYFKAIELGKIGNSIAGLYNSPQISVLSVSLNYDPEKTFDIYDPVTLEPTGQTMTHQEMYLALFSAYMSTAKARDAKNAEPVGNTE